MADDSESTIKNELSRTERLLWFGRPRQGVFLRRSDAFLIPFSILWGGFAIFWETTAVLQGASFTFMLWGIPFVLLGLYLIFGRFFVDAKQRARISYGVTTERVLIVSRLFRHSVKSLNLETLTDVTLNEKSDGTGTITFGATHPMYSWFSVGLSWPGSGSYATPCFEMVKDARAVYETIRTAQRQRRVRTR